MHACLKQMTLDLELRGLAKHTRSEYLRYARLFATYHDRSPRTWASARSSSSSVPPAPPRRRQGPPRHPQGPPSSARRSRRWQAPLRRARRVLPRSAAPFGDDTQVFRYLGQYTHRVGLSNHRLVAFDGREVTFRTRGPARVTLEADQFLRRFVLHVLPKGFAKIRHHGLFAAGNVHTKLATARALLPAATSPLHKAPPADGAPRDFRELLLALTGVDLRHCSRCGALALVRLPLDPSAALGTTLPPSPAFTSPPPDTS